MISLQPASCYEVSAAAGNPGQSSDARWLLALAAAPSSSPPSSSLTRAKEPLYQGLLAAVFESDPTLTPSPGTLAALGHAVSFVRALPSGIEAPEFAVDVDGDIAVEWDFGPRQTLSVRISHEAVIYYAGLDGMAAFSGRESFAGAVPGSVLQGIGRITSNR